jgi:hypothetical protein
MKLSLVLPALLLVAGQPCLGQNVSSDFPTLETIVHDSSSLSNQLIAASMTLNPLGSHAFLFSGDATPMIHIWGDGSSSDVLQERPLGIQWWEGQGLWTLLYLDESDSTAALISEDLENFETLSITRLFDSRAICLTENGKRITLTLDYRNAYDREDWVMGDSVMVEWLSWHIENSIGQIEVIDLADVYAELDLYDYGYHVKIGSTDTTADPIHPNSLSHFLYDTVEYLGSSNRTLNELLIMRETPSGRNFYHYGGPLNQFSISSDSAIAYKAHDLRILDATENIVTVSCFSNGDGTSVGGDYSAGKVIRLNLDNFTSELLEQVILTDTAISIGMGSFETTTNTFSPGIFMDSESPLGIAPTIVVETDEDGNRELEIKWVDSPGINFRTDRYSPQFAAPSLKRPTLLATCDESNDRILLEATKEGEFDAMLFFANGAQLTTEVTGLTTAFLPYDFTGQVTVASRLTFTELDFVVDKYSDILTIPTDYCASTAIDQLSGDESPLFATLVNRTIILDGFEGGVVLDMSGRQVASSNLSQIGVDHLVSGMYVVTSSNGMRSQRIYIP